MDEVKSDRQLQGKTNFISWKREFERAARANDALEFLTGEEVVPTKPNKDDYLAKVSEIDTRRSTRVKKALTPTTDDGDEADDGQSIVLTTNNTLRWQIDYNEHKAAKEKMKLAGKLLDMWVSDGIKIEIEDCADAKEAYDFIKKRYAVTNERARDKYTNQIRQIKADLKTVKYDMTDDIMTGSDQPKLTNPPDLDYLFERLHVEEMHQYQAREERKARDKARRDTNANGTPNMDSNARYKPRREDRGHLRCTYPGCGKTGHTEEYCWVKSPEKIPRSLKEKFANNPNRANLANGMGGVAEMDLKESNDTYVRNDTLGSDSSSPISSNPANSLTQMHRAVSCVSLGRSGGVVTENPVTETLNFSKPVLGAFLAGTFCTTDTWLADTGANMHIVNDMKWFMKDKFHPSNLKISTADGSTTLKIEGTGVVRLLLRCPDGFQVKVSLSEVAYAPEGKCNLFSGGMFVRKAKVTGVYNEKYMTWIDGAGFTVGHAIFDNGLYHLKATKVSSQDIPDNLIAATIDFDDPVWIWHRRLGHLGFQNMLMLLNSSTGMEITEKQIKAKLKAVCPVVPTPDLEMPSHIPSGEENEGSDEEDSDQADDQDQRMSEAAHESSYEIGSADDEYDTEEEDSATAVMSKYFNPPRHAGMAKRKVTDIPTVVPRKSRRATHDLLDVELAHSDSDFADSDDDSWYYSDDGKISRAYWQFVAKHGGNHMKTFLPDDGRKDWKPYRRVTNAPMTEAEGAIVADPAKAASGESRHAPTKLKTKTNSIASCNYRLSDGTYEAWAVRSFEVNDLGERTLRTDYEHFTGRGKIKVSQELKAIRDSLETKLPKERRTNQLKSADISDSDASRAEPNVQQRPAPSSSKQFKYGLTAYTEHDPPDLSLKMGGGANSKYHEAKMEELKSHREKGNKCYGQ
ncbi:uncharacterized protein N7469_008433 [Penicillium citrinum]|uniref:GAG-pre-integrase domain-containing protein n=1 Tax=Penicillium citrinum TaxID=5077 RepID=A0A9W9NLZ0_PENCI|nr:uncharacterized protein N7469_008433 [Penicillium citrinum]KAJ5222193.1 hypothetical protein N7469_008433 [Penicillium citrinum]